MIIVEIKGYSDEENIEYLKYNGYGKLIKKISDNTYLCIGGTNNYIDLCDITIKKIFKPLLSDYTSQNEKFYNQLN